MDRELEGYSTYLSPSLSRLHSFPLFPPIQQPSASGAFSAKLVPLQELLHSLSCSSLEQQTIALSAVLNLGPKAMEGWVGKIKEVQKSS